MVVFDAGGCIGRRDRDQFRETVPEARGCAADVRKVCVHNMRIIFAFPSVSISDIASGDVAEGFRDRSTHSQKNEISGYRMETLFFSRYGMSLNRALLESCTPTYDVMAEVVDKSCTPSSCARIHSRRNTSHGKLRGSSEYFKNLLFTRL